MIGAGATRVQVASIFNAFGSRVTLFEAAPRILASEDEEVAEAMSTAMRAAGVRILEDAGTIERFEPCPAGVRLVYSGSGGRERVDATLAVVAVGWVANTEGLDLAVAGVRTDMRGFIEVDSRLRTTAPGIYAAGDVTGHIMVVHEAAREAYLAPTDAAVGRTNALPAEVSPLGSFTDPEYASVGLSEATARETHDVVVGKSVSTRCRARSSTVARRICSSSWTEKGTPSSAGTSWASEPSSSPNWRRSR